MRVSSVACQKKYWSIYQSDRSISNNTSNCKPQELACDTVCFSGGASNDLNSDTQFYRAIGESEYKALIRGETIFSSGYVTNNPKGYLGLNWNTAFRSSEKENIYFVTFKKEGLPLVASRDFWNDPRIGLSGYTIDNIENIRKGTNIHGELVFARDFKSAQVKDRNNKLMDIRSNLKILARSKDSLARQDAWDCLSSYVKEFPKISNDALKYVNKKDAGDLRHFILLLCETDRKEDIPKLNEAINNFIKIRKMPSNVLSFMSKYGNCNDIPILLKVVDKFSKDDAMDLKATNIGKTMATISDGSKKTHKLVYKSLISSDINKLNVLANYFAGFNCDGSFTPIFRKILNKCLKLDKKYIFSKNYDATIQKCAEMVSLYGSLDDINLLNKFIETHKNAHPKIDSLQNAVRLILKRFGKLV